jgi:hypothetical protein
LDHNAAERRAFTLDELHAALSAVPRITAAPKPAADTA